jgi:hypothetical protein
VTSVPTPLDAAARAAIRRTMVVELATLSAKGRPFVTPIWFVASGGALYMTTAPGSRAGRNVARHPAVTLLFHGGPRGALRVRGRATCHRGLPPWRVLGRIAAKYYVAPGALLLELRNARRWGLRARYYREGKGGFGYLRVVPDAAERLPAP